MLFLVFYRVCCGLTLIVNYDYNAGLFRAMALWKWARTGGAMDRRIRQVLRLQIAALFLISLGVFTAWGAGAALAAGFGIFITLANTLLIAWRMRPNNKMLGKPASLNEFIRSWLERYLVVGVLLALGLGSLKLLPLGLLSGFILGQLIWILAPLTIKET